MEWAFFAIGVLSLLITLNAVRPIRWDIMSVPAFFNGWIATELAVHRLAIQVVAIVAFVVAGALHGWQGLTGLLALIVSVRDWVDDIDPGDEATMRAGVGAALHALASGASVAEAAGYARSCVTSRLRHPSHPAMWSGRIPAAS